MLHVLPIIPRNKTSVLFEGGRGFGYHTRHTPPPRYILMSREITKHHLTSLVRHLIPAGLFWFAAWLYIACNTYMYSQFSVVLPLYGPAKHSMMQYVSIRVTFAIFSIVAYRTCAETGSRRGIIDTSRHQVMVSLKDFRCEGIHRCGRCPVSIDLHIY